MVGVGKPSPGEREWTEAPARPNWPEPPVLAIAKSVAVILSGLNAALQILRTLHELSFH